MWTLDEEKFTFSSYGEHILVRNVDAAMLNGAPVHIMIQMRTDLVETETEAHATKLRYGLIVVKAHLQ